MISSSAFVMGFNTAILTAFFGESFDFVRVLSGFTGSAFLATGSQRARLRVSLCGLMLHANAVSSSSAFSLSL